MVDYGLYGSWRRGVFASEQYETLPLTGEDVRQKILLTLCGEDPKFSFPLARPSDSIRCCPLFTIDFCRFGGRTERKIARFAKM